MDDEWSQDEQAIDDWLSSSAPNHLPTPTGDQLADASQSIADRVGQRRRKRARRQWAAQIAIVLILVGIGVFALWPTPQVIEPAAPLSAYRAIDCHTLSPNPHPQLPQFNADVPTVETIAGFPLYVPQQLPIAFEFVGAAWNAGENSAEITFIAPNQSWWIISQRLLENDDGLLTTLLGPQDVTTLSGTFEQMGDQRVVVVQYQYAGGRIATIEWTTESVEVKVTVYVADGGEISAETLAQTVAQFQLIQP